MVAGKKGDIARKIKVNVAKVDVYRHNTQTKGTEFDGVMPRQILFYESAYFSTNARAGALADRRDACPTLSDRLMGREGFEAFHENHFIGTSRDLDGDGDGGATSD